MVDINFDPKAFVVTIRDCMQIDIDTLYSELKGWSSSEDSMPFAETAERNLGYEIYGGETTDYIVILKGDWIIRFDNETSAREFETVRITGGILLRKDGGNPYIEAGNQFIQNLIKMHTKFSFLPATKQLETDFHRLTNREHPISSISLAYFDIECFKRFNTDYGEKNVDIEVLSPFHRWLIAEIGSRACVYLEGGDEFVTLLPGLDLEDAKTFCEGIVKAIDERNFLIAGKEENFTVSMGLASLRDTDKLEDLINRANTKKKYAKLKGKTD